VDRREGERGFSRRAIARNGVGKRLPRREQPLTKIYQHALCLHPYFRDSHSGSLGLAVFPPTGLEYICSALKPHVEKVTFLDLRLAGPLRDVDRLREFVRKEVDLLCISVNWEYHFDEVCRLINGLPRNVTTVVGGKQATDYVEEVFAACPGVDVVVRGEGEETIAEFASGADLSGILGISYRKGTELVHNPTRPLADVDAYHYPDRSLRSQKYHFNIGGLGFRGEEFDIILTSRGCPYNCKFCTFNLNPWTQKRRYSARSIDSVIEEIKGLTAGIILVADENFFVNPRRAKKICNRIVDEGIDKRFVVQSRIEICEHPDVLDAAAKAGIKLFLFGIESPTNRILKQLDKGFDTDKVRESFEIFRKYPFYCHGYFIYGNVNETEAEMMRIPDFAKELGLDSITYQKLRIERYSPLRELVEQAPGYFIGDDRIVYSEALMRPGLKRISKQITRRFYTPAQLLKILRKIFRIRLFTIRNVPPLLLSVPILLGNITGRKINKTMRRYQLWKRLFPRWA
jgi:radical SAM superfamily enzyme YgiQ (UPF0313 family)